MTSEPDAQQLHERAFLRDISRLRPFALAEAVAAKMCIRDRGECVLIEDLDAIKGVVDPREYETLHVQEIASLVVAPIERDGRLVGFLGMDNPPACLLYTSRCV